MDIEGLWIKVGAKFDEVEKALQKLPYDAQKAASEMEQAFKAVGVKNLEKEFRDAQAAFELLERSGTLTAKQLADAADNVKAKWAAWKEEIDDGGGALGRFAAQATTIGAALTAAVTGPLVALGTAAFDAAEKLDGAFDKIRVGTGATGEQLGALQGSFRNVFKDVSDDANKVATAISALSTRTGQVGPGLETLTRQFLDLSRVTGEQMEPAIAKTTRLFGDWSVAVDKQVPVMDTLFKVSQQTGISFTALADKLVYAGAPFRQLGLSIEESAIMLGKFEKEGVNVELVIGAMRTALAKFGKAGLEPVDAFKQLVASIKNADVAQGNLIAAQVVGTKRMADFAAAVREGRLDLDGLFKTVMNSKETIGQAAKDIADYGEAWKTLKNQLTVALEPLGAGLFNALTDVIKIIQPGITLVTSLAQAFASLPPGVQTAAIALAGLAAALGPMLVTIGGLAAIWPSVVTGLGSMGIAAGTLTTTMTALGAAVGVAAAAFAMYTWYESFQKLREAEKHAENVGTALEQGVARLEATASKMGITVDRAGKSLDQYANELNKAVRAAPDYQKQLAANAEAADKAAKSLEKLPPQIRMTIESYQTMATQMRAAGKIDEALKIEKTIEDLKKLGGGAKQVGIDFGHMGGKIKDAAKEAAQAIQHAFSAVGLHNLQKEYAEAQKGLDLLAAKGVLTGRQLEQAAENVRKKYVAWQDSMRDIGTMLETSTSMGFKGLERLIAKHAEWVMQGVQQKLVTFEFEQTSAALTKIEAALLNSKIYMDPFVGGFLSAGKAMREAAEDAKTLGIVTGEQLAARAREATEAYERMSARAGTSMRDTIDVQKALIKALEAQMAAARAAGEPWQDLEKKLNSAKEALGRMTGESTKASSEMGKAWGDFGKQVSTVMTDFGKDIADAIVYLKNLGEAFTKMANAIKEAFMRTIVEGAIKQVMKGLDDVGLSFGKLAKTAIDNLSAIGKSITGLFGGGVSTAVNAAGGGASGAAGAAGGASGAAGAAGGVLGAIGAIGSIGSLISGVIGNFQMSGMNKTLDLIEKEVRYSQIHLKNMLEFANTWWPWMENLKYLQIMESLERVLYESNEHLSALASGVYFNALADSLEGFGDEMYDFGQRVPVEIGGAIEQVGQRMVASLNTSVQANNAATNRGLTTLANSIGAAMSPMLNELQLMRKTTQEQLRIVAEGVWATYSAVSKPGWQTTVPSLPGGPANTGPSFPRTPSSTGPNTNVTVNVTSNSSNPYNTGLQVAQGINAILPARV